MSLKEKIQKARENCWDNMKRRDPLHLFCKTYTETAESNEVLSCLFNELKSYREDSEDLVVITQIVEFIEGSDHQVSADELLAILKANNYPTHY